MTYAAYTKVAIEKSRIELEKVLQVMGATERATLVSDERREVVFAFRLGARKYRMIFPVPDDPQAARARWRAILLAVKAKAMIIDMGVSTPEHEFMADMIMPDGQRVAEAVRVALQGTGRTLQLGAGST